MANEVDGLFPDFCTWLVADLATALSRDRASLQCARPKQGASKGSIGETIPRRTDNALLSLAFVIDNVIGSQWRRRRIASLSAAKTYTHYGAYAMFDRSPTDYKALFEREKREREREREEREREREEREREREERERERKEREREREQRERERQRERGERALVEADLLRERERTQKTTFSELLLHCHDLLSVPLRAHTPSKSTAGSIPLPVGKYCPRRLRLLARLPSDTQRDV